MSYRGGAVCLLQTDRDLQVYHPGRHLPLSGLRRICLTANTQPSYYYKSRGIHGLPPGQTSETVRGQGPRSASTDLQTYHELREAMICASCETFLFDSGEASGPCRRQKYVYAPAQVDLVVSRFWWGQAGAKSGGRARAGRRQMRCVCVCVFLC